MRKPLWLGNAQIVSVFLILVLSPAVSQGSTLNLTDVTILGASPAAGHVGFLTGSLGGTAFFARSDVQSSGTGVIDPFLILQAKGTEKGYNTDGNLQYDTKQAHFTRNLQLSELATVLVDGVQYYEFHLDADQDASSTLGKAVLSIDQIKIYTSPTASIDNIGSLSDLGTARFDLGTNSIFIDAGIGSTAGAGSDDMIAFIPVTAFAGASSGDYIYFFNFNGTQLESNDGREQWSALLGGNATVPEPSTLILLGSALAAMALIRKKK